MIRRRLTRLLRMILLFTLFLVLVAPETPALSSEEYQLDTIVGLREFDFLVWELKAIRVKAEAILTNAHGYLDEPTRKAMVLDYLADISEIDRLEQQLAILYADPDSSIPGATAAELLAELELRRADLALRQPVVEAIVQDQVADVLIKADFALLGQAWPPVMIHMTPLPSILIVSPRERIERLYGIPLAHGLSTPVIEGLETTVFEQLDLSALVVPIGGLGIYPAMLLETSNITRLVEVTAHEWVHHWLGPYPISLYYGIDNQVRTMNETVASIVASEVGREVMEKYYPEFVPPPGVERPTESEATPDSVEPPAFDFRMEMAKTRLEVNKLLENGSVEEAEAYMEARRALFWENGFLIRKLNQAYFAFYGAYADEPGATGGDPIGPMLLEVRNRSSSLKEFMQVMAPINSFEELKDVLEILRARET